MLLSLLSLCLFRLDEFGEQTARTLLAAMGRRAGGPWLELVVALDAFIVLSGAVRRHAYIQARALHARANARTCARASQVLC